MDYEQNTKKIFLRYVDPRKRIKIFFSFLCIICATNANKVERKLYHQKNRHDRYKRSC